MTVLPENKLKPVAVALAAAGGLLVAAGLAYLFLTPQSYTARARIKVIHWVHANEADGRSDLQLVSTECDVIRSNAVLDSVIQTLNLGDAWGKRFHQGVALSADEARARLNSQLSVEAVTDSELIDIRFSSANREETAQVANGVAQAYLELRGAEHEAVLDHKRNALKQQWADENEKINKAQAAVDQEYFDIMKGRQTNSFRVYDANGYSSNRIRIEAQFIAQKNELDGLKRMDQDDLAQVLSSMETNSAILPLLSSLNKAKTAELNAKLEHGADSREFKDAALVKERIQQEIGRYLATAMAIKEDKLTALKSALAEMDSGVKNSTSNLGQARAEYSVYTNALQNLNTLKQERENLQKKMGTFEKDAVTATAVTAQLIDSAEIPGKPSVPDGMLALGIMGAGLVCGVAGLIVLLVGQRNANVATKL